MVNTPDCIAIFINGLRTLNEKNARDKQVRIGRSKFGQRRKVYLPSVASQRAQHQRGLARIMVQAGTSKAQRDIFAAGCSCLLVRLAPRTMVDESDSLRFALPHVRDGVADALDVDDRDAKHGGAVAWDYAQEHSRGYGVRIELRPRAPLPIIMPASFSAFRLPSA